MKSALKRKQAAQPGYSLRALARDLGVSPAFVSNMMAGKKLPPKNRLEKLSYCLELDVLEREQLVKLSLLAGLSPKLLGHRPGPSLPQTRRTSEVSNRHLLASWANLAVLEGLTLDGAWSDLEELRGRLGLTAPALERVIETLAAAGVIEERHGRWVKKDEHLYLAGGRSRQEVRAFHEMMILKSRDELVTKTAQADFERRLINGFTLAMNPEKLEVLKAKIIEFMDELSREAAAGPCTEVYQCNFQFFPLTRKAT
jgi:DNA-binding MarR family transcriptional regulator